MKEIESKSTASRRAIILELLESEGQVDVNNLSQQLHVSEVTIRKDLASLERSNLLVRARGGAIKATPVGLDVNLSEKKKQNLKEKKRIGKAAASLIDDGDTIILDSGSTTLEVSNNLSKISGLNVITNSLSIVSNLTRYNHITVIMPGGLLRTTSMSLVGSPAEESIRNYHCDKLFLGVDGFDTTSGLSTPNVEEAYLNRAMIDIASEVIVVTDSSKFSRKSFAFIADLSKVDKVITDANISSDDEKKLNKLGIEVIIAR